MLADTHGNVIVVGTRDCSLQRRNQKLVEEAPAPFLTDEQREPHPRVGQGDLQGGRLPRRRHGRVPRRRRRLDLLPRGQHPAAGRAPGHRGDQRPRPGPPAVPHRRRRGAGRSPRTPTPRGHSIEFRINAEDAGRNFLPAPGPVNRLEIPQGPGVRWDSGVETGGEVAGAFDSMLAKLIVTGATRERGAAARPPGAGRAGRRGHAHGHPVPPRRRPRRGVHQRAVHRAHPVDRDRVGQPGRRPTTRAPAEQDEAGAAADRRRRGRRTPARGLPAGRPGRRRRGARRGRQAAQARRRAAAAPPRPATP